MPSIADLLRAEVTKALRVGSTLERLAADSDVNYITLYRFHRNEGRQLSLVNAERLLTYFGFELRKMRNK